MSDQYSVGVCVLFLYPFLMTGLRSCMLSIGFAKDETKARYSDHSRD